MGDKGVSKYLRLSPNEIEEAVREEKKKWRQFRIQQVREQAREESRRILSNVRYAETKAKGEVVEGVRRDWQAERDKRVRKLQQEHHDCLQAIGHAHKMAEMQPDAERVLRERQQANDRVARQRGAEAGKVQKEQDNQLHQERVRAQRLRQEALDKEKLRAARIAKLPTPTVFQEKPVKEVTVKDPRVQLYEAGTFTTTTYVPHLVKIEREVFSTKPDGRAAAEMERAAQAEKEAAQRAADLEAARKREERGREALARERVTHMAQDLVAGLDKVQQQHRLSALLGSSHFSVLEAERKRVAEQQKMEKAVEKVLQHPEPPSTTPLPSLLSPETSPGIEAIDSALIDSIGRSSRTRVTDLSAFLEQIKRQRDQLKQVYSPAAGDASTEERMEDTEQPDTEHPEAEIDPSPYGRRMEEPEDPHLAETVPIDQLPRPRQRDERTGLERREQISTTDTSTESPGPSGRTGGLEGTYTSTLSTSSILPHLPGQYSYSGVGSTDYMSPPSSLPSRREPTDIWDERNQREDTSDDIHLAETVPVDRLPLRHRTTTRTHRHTLDSTQSSSYMHTEDITQDSNSDDIHIRVELSGDSGSTLKPVTPDDESYLGRKSSMSYSGVSSTDYLSPPLQLPRHETLSQNLKEILQKLQEKRETNQRLIDSMSSTPPHQASQLSSTSGFHRSYTQQLKGEGRGTRPQNRRKKQVKYEMQKQKLLEYYLKKLLDMKGEEVKNISASTVESSGVDISSLTSLLESLEWDETSSLTTTLLPASLTSSVSRAASMHSDIDHVPVKLTSSSSVSEGDGSEFGSRVRSHPTVSSEYASGQDSARSTSVLSTSNQSAHGHTPIASSSSLDTSEISKDSSRPFPERVPPYHRTTGPSFPVQIPTRDGGSLESSSRISSYDKKRLNRASLTEQKNQETLRTEKLQGKNYEKEHQVEGRSPSITFPRRWSASQPPRTLVTTTQLPPSHPSYTTPTPLSSTYITHTLPSLPSYTTRTPLTSTVITSALPSQPSFSTHAPLSSTYTTTTLQPHTTTTTTRIPPSTSTTTTTFSEYSTTTTQPSLSPYATTTLTPYITTTSQKPPPSTLTITLPPHMAATTQTPPSTYITTTTRPPYTDTTTKISTPAYTTTALTPLTATTTYTPLSTYNPTTSSTITYTPLSTYTSPKLTPYTSTTTYLPPSIPYTTTTPITPYTVTTTHPSPSPLVTNTLPQLYPYITTPHLPPPTRTSQTPQLPHTTITTPQFPHTITTSSSLQPHTTTSAPSTSHTRSSSDKRLDTIQETSSDLIDSHLTESGSASYHTPSREYESSLGASSDVSIPHRHTSQLGFVTPSVHPQTATSSDDEHKRTFSQDRPRQRQQLELDYQYNYKRQDLLVFERKKGKKCFETKPDSATRSDKTRREPDYPVQSSSIDKSLISSEKTERVRPNTRVFASSLDPSQQHHHSELSLPQPATDHSISPLLPQSSLLSQALSLPQSISLSQPSPLPQSPPMPSGGATEERRSSESVNSIPDIGEVLQRLGLDWAGSMIRKMDRAEHEASSDTSSGHQV